MNAKRGPNVVKSTTRAATGGALVIAALLALMFFKSGGDGAGDAEAPEVGTPDAPMLTSTQAPTDSPLSSVIESSASGGLTTDEQQALSDGVLTLLIDEHEYLMQIPSGSDAVYRKIPLARLLQLAKQTTGDNNGIRVRIQRRESSRASAEHELTTELQQAGVGEDAVYMASEFVP